MGSPFRLEVLASEFYIPIISVPGMMTQFQRADVGVRYYALFKANFPVCGRKYGSPPVRYDAQPFLSLFCSGRNLYCCGVSYG